MRNLIKSSLKDKIAFKISVIYIFIAIFTIIMVAFASFSFYSSYINKYSQMEKTKIIDTMESNIEEKMKYYNQLANTLCVDADIIRYLSINPTEKTDINASFNNINNKITNITIQNKDFESIKIYSANEYIKFDNNIINKENTIGNMLWFTNAMNKKIFTTPTIDEQNGKSAISFVRYIFDFASSSHSNMLGVIVINIKASSIFLDIEANLTNNVGYIFVEDKNHNVIYSNKPEFIGKQFPDSILPENVKLTKVENVNYIDYKKLYIFRNLDTNNWSIVFITNIVSITALSVNLIKVTIITSIIMLLSFTPVTFLLSNKMYGRLRILNQQIKGMGQGLFNFKPIANSKDEIGVLSVKVYDTSQQLKHLMEENRIQMEEKKELDLRFVRSQIKPYLLYNTLSTIYWKSVEKRIDDLGEITVSLSEYYRLSLHGETDLLSLGHEIEHAKAYIRLQKIVYPDLIDFVFTVEENLKDRLVVKSMLQPLIENAVIHGILPKGFHGTVIINCEYKDNLLIINIIDDGVGFLKKHSENLSETGIGIKSIEQRIKLTFSDKYGITIFSKPGIGSCVTIMLP